MALRTLPPGEILFLRLVSSLEDGKLVFFKLIFPYFLTVLEISKLADVQLLDAIPTVSNCSCQAARLCIFIVVNDAWSEARQKHISRYQPWRFSIFWGHQGIPGGC